MSDRKLAYILAVFFMALFVGLGGIFHEPAGRLFGGAFGMVFSLISFGCSREPW